MFVPVVRHREREEELSSRARDLGERLATSIREFQRQYPGTSDADLRGALRHAGHVTGVRSSRPDPRAPAIIAAVVAAALGAGVFASQSGASGAAPTAVPWVAVAVVLGAVGAVVAAVLARRRSS